MTPSQAVEIAEAAIRAFDCRHDLQRVEQRNADNRSLRTLRRALADAESELERAITATVTR